MTLGYKVFHCRYRWSGGFGAYEEIDCIVVAEILSKALGMALTENPESHPECWSGEEIPIEKEGVFHVSSASN